MPTQERRRGEKPRASNLRTQLSPDQRMELAILERFGWELKFIRRPPFQDPIAVVYDNDSGKYAVLKEDGSLDEKPSIVIRP